MEAIAARERMYSQYVKEEKGLSAIAFVRGPDLVLPGRQRNLPAARTQGQGAG